MPQGRRKVPYSTKQKKAQLQQKREQKRGDWSDEDNKTKDRVVQKGKGLMNIVGQCQSEEDSSDQVCDHEVKKINFQPVKGNSKHKHNPNKYHLHFKTETKEDLERRKLMSTHPIIPVSERCLEMDIDAVFLPGSELDIPKRPSWDYNTTKEQLEAREQKYFREYLKNIEDKFSVDELSYFELNLETWRQLWRVLELSDMLLIIVDIRFPALLFSPALYDHVTRELNKDIVLVLNKIDLAPAGLVAAWKSYFLDRFPELRIVYFTSFPGSSVRDPVQVGRRRTRGRLRMAAEGAKRLLEVCEDIVDGGVDLSSWRAKIEEEMCDTSEDLEVVPPSVSVEKQDMGYTEHEKYKDGVLSIGCLGHPNVGKSSLMNALMGRKVVSVSRTPGHTKHFQTIFLTPTVKLCDCPGLIFPSKVPQPLQILSGCYPIAQVREPYSSIRYVAERMSLPTLLKLKHPTSRSINDPGDQWSAYDICDAWAEKRGFLTAKAARHDVYRAANNLLRMALEARICLCTRPPGYSERAAYWDIDSAVDEIARIVDRKCQLEADDVEDDASSIDDDDVTEHRGSDDSGDNASEEESDEDRPTVANKYSLLRNE